MMQRIQNPYSALIVFTIAFGEEIRATGSPQWLIFSSSILSRSLSISEGVYNIKEAISTSVKNLQLPNKRYHWNYLFMIAKP